MSKLIVPQITLFDTILNETAQLYLSEAVIEVDVKPVFGGLHHIYGKRVS